MLSKLIPSKCGIIVQYTAPVVFYFFFLHALKRLKERNTSLKTSNIHKEYKFSIPCKQNFPQEKYFAARFIDFLKLRDLN